MSVRNIFLISCVFLVMTSGAMAAPALAVDASSFKVNFERPKDIPFPKDNSFSDAKYKLGKTLFFDTRLSASGVTSCATCHNPSFHWSDGLVKGVGHGHLQLGRKTPTVLNLAWDDLYFWDGRADSLEAQALGPIASTTEMNMPHENMVKNLRSISGYRPLFEGAFPGDKNPITKENIAKAIATFERKIVSGTSPFDQWLAGDEKAISGHAKNGFLLFNTKAQCVACHSGWNFSDGSFHDIGMASNDIGRGKFAPKTPILQYAFKTVGLRNIAERGPYMHDGSLPALEDVVNHYNNGFVKRPSLATEIKPLNLTGQEKSDIVAFLKTLTSVDTPVTLPLMPR